jgi:hypothetical protein
VYFFSLRFIPSYTINKDEREREREREERERERERTMMNREAFDSVNHCFF